MSDERGMALALAVFALVVIGAMVAGSFFTARLEQQSGQNTLFARQADAAAEAGLSEATANLTASTLDGLPVGGAPLDLGTIMLGNGLSTSRRVSRLTETLVLVRAQGVKHNADGAALASRSVGALLHLFTGARLTERGWVQLY